MATTAPAYALEKDIDDTNSYHNVSRLSSENDARNGYRNAWETVVL